jgi:hypothetical protein
LNPSEKVRFGDAAHIVPPTVARRLDSAESPAGFDLIQSKSRL